MDKTLDKKLCELAESYVNDYYRVGSRSYAWDETNDSDDDLDGSVACGECPPSDADHYSWWEVVSCEIHSSDVDARNDETGEYCVTVEAWVAVSSGNEDEDVDETVEPDLRTIYVQIDRFDDGDYRVTGTEE